MATATLARRTAHQLRTLTSGWQGAVVAALLLAFAVVLLHAAWWDTPSMDELIHIPAGLTYIDLGDPRMNYEHPPLMKLLAGVGATVAGAHLDPTISGWHSGSEERLRLGFQDRFAGSELRRIIFFARLPMIAISLLLAACVYFYARSLTGPAGGLFSLALFVTYPLILAFGATVLNDILVTLGCLLTCAAMARLWQRPSGGSVTLYGLALGFALLAKFSALVLIPISLLYWGVELFRGPRPWLRESMRRLPAIIAGFALASGLIWTTYFVTFRHADARSFAANYFQQPIPQPGTAAYTATRKRVQWFAQLEQHRLLAPVLMPVFYYGAGVRFVMTGAARPVYLLGRRYPTGQWFYFPLLVLTKSSPGFVVLLLLGSLLLLRPSIWRTVPPQAIALALFFLVYTVVALRMRLNIGLRHYMPGLVSGMILLALLIPLLRRKWFAAVTAACLGSLFWVAVAQYPFYIPYFNFLASGKPAGWVASDSNVDFGMSLRAADQFAEKHHLAEVAVVPFYPNVYHLRDMLSAAHSWDCNNSTLPAGPYLIVSEHRFFDQRYPHECDSLLQYPHHPLAGGSLEVFDLGARPRNFK